MTLVWKEKWHFIRRLLLSPLRSDAQPPLASCATISIYISSSTSLCQVSVASDSGRRWTAALHAVVPLRERLDLTPLALQSPPLPNQLLTEWLRGVQLPAAPCVIGKNTLPTPLTAGFEMEPVLWLSSAINSSMLFTSPTETACARSWGWQTIGDWHWH